MIDVLIIAPEITKGMKSIGSKALLSLKGSLTILEYQIQQIKNSIPSSKITIATGFDADKIKKDIPLKYKLNFLHNDRYKTTNQTECINLYLEKENCQNLLIIPNGIIFKNIDFNLVNDSMSRIFMIDKPKNNFTIGSSDSIYAEYLFYDLPIVWSECVFFDYEAILEIKKILKLEKIEQLYVFELINKLIDKKVIFEKHFFSKKNIMKINNNKDIIKAKQFI